MSAAAGSPKDHDVVIVGGGPVGLTLALGLARAGVHALVLEKGATTAEHSRAPAIWPRTQEIFADLGLIDRFTDAGLSVPCAELWDVDRRAVLLRVPVEELRGETSYPRLVVLPQSKTERILYEEIRETVGAQVLFGCEVTSLIQDSFGVDVVYRRLGHEERVRAKFVAGCDGAHSAVRAHLGGTLEGKTYAAKAALADVRVTGQQDLRFPRFSDTPRLTIALRMEQNLWRLIFPYKATVEPDLDLWVTDACETLFPQRGCERVWMSEFRLHRRISSHWVEGRIVLAGDAAHLNSPVGGEGMNSGIEDAALLWRALGKAVSVDHPQPLVDYVANRRRAVETGVNAFTDTLTRFLLSGGGRFIRPAFAVARLAFSVAPLRHRILRKLALLDLPS